MYVIKENANETEKQNSGEWVWEELGESHGVGGKGGVPFLKLGGGVRVCIVGLGVGSTGQCCLTAQH